MRGRRGERSLVRRLSTLRFEPAARETVASRWDRVRLFARCAATDLPRAVTPPVSILAAAAALLAACLLPADEGLSRFLVVPGGDLRSILDRLTDIALIRWYFHPALLLALALLVLDPRGRDEQSFALHRDMTIAAAHLAASLGLASAITHLLKWSFGRIRPIEIDTQGALSFAFLRMGETAESFPSGHSTNAGALSMVLAIWFPALRWPILVLGFAVATTRIAVAAHFPSDVVAGFAIGALTALVLARLLALQGVLYRVRKGSGGWRGLVPWRATARPPA